MEINDELLIRRKRVNELGEWEYECRYCELWLPQNRFRGCVDYIDAYGNCLMCSSCKAKKAQITQKDNIQKELKLLLKRIGYDPDSNISIHEQFCKKHNLPLKIRE